MVAGGPGDGLSKLKNGGVFSLAEVQGGVQLLQDNQLSSVPDRLPYQAF